MTSTATGYKIVRALITTNPYRVDLCSFSMDSLIYFTYKMEMPTIYKDDNYFSKCDVPVLNLPHKVFPPFGKLFCFDNQNNTWEIVNGHGLFQDSDIYVLSGEMENPKRIKRVALYPKRFLDFWMCKKRKKKFEFETTQTPIGTVGCDSFFPQCFYKAKDFHEQFVPKEK